MLLCYGVFTLGGCASPGVPKPPSLNIPEKVSDLRAERVGDAVNLFWTTPAETTDHVTLRGPVTAEVCRSVAAETGPERGKAARGGGGGTPCVTVAVEHVPAGQSTAVDPLPAELRSGAFRVLEYRVRLPNGAGKDAGASDAARVAAGPAPERVGQLAAECVPAGVKLTWTRATAQVRTRVELVRSLAGAKTRGGRKGAKKGADGRGPQPTGVSPAAEAAVVRLLAAPAGTADRGGTIDGTARAGETYTYRAERYEEVVMGGQVYSLRGAESDLVTVRVVDVAAPGVPKGLVAAAGEGLEVDLAWEPEFEEDLAGYVVERAELPGKGAVTGAEVRWIAVSAGLVASPGLHDVVPHAGRFGYRVRSQDRAGNRSAPSAPVVVELGPMQQ